MPRPRRALPPPESAGPLDFPLTPAMGSSGPLLPVAAALFGLALFALAVAPVLWPADLALLALQGVALAAAWWVCERAGDELPRLSAHAAFPLPGQIAYALATDTVVRAPAASGASLLVDGVDYPVKDLALIGRSEDCHVCLDDPTLALYQAALVPSGDRLAIVKLSTTELTVNGLHRNEAPLEPGDVVKLGRSTLVYYRDAAALSGPPLARLPGPPVARLVSPAGELPLHRGAHYWIGRDPERCDLAVSDPAAAERHALITVGAGGLVTLVDFTSPLGTRINRRRSHFRTLAHGDVLELGQTLVRFVEHAS